MLHTSRHSYSIGKYSQSCMTRSSMAVSQVRDTLMSQLGFLLFLFPCSIWPLELAW